MAFRRQRSLHAPGAYDSQIPLPRNGRMPWRPPRRSLLRVPNNICLICHRACGRWHGTHVTQLAFVGGQRWLNWSYRLRAGLAPVEMQEPCVRIDLPYAYKTKAWKLILSIARLYEGAMIDERPLSSSNQQRKRPSDALCPGELSITLNGNTSTNNVTPGHSYVHTWYPLKWDVMGIETNPRAYGNT